MTANRHLVRNATFALSLAGVLAIAGCTSSGNAQPGTNTQGASGATTAASTGGAAVTGFQAKHKGGTLVLEAVAASGTLDPQVDYTNQYWQVYQYVYDGLMAFNKLGGSKSFDLVPDLAAAEPEVTNGGKTYTFTLRKGIKFANGQPLTPADVVASFQRIFKVHSPTAGTYYNEIVGADACLETPATCTLAGGVVAKASTNQVVFNLTSPNPSFLFELAIPHASILPKDAPAKDGGDTPIPGTGAYMFKSYNPNQMLEMVRNPYFKQWSRTAQPQGYPDVIDYKFGGTAENDVTAIENGTADWMFDQVPSDRLGEVSSKYANQLYVHSEAGIYYIPLNTNLPPFNNEKARQAVNWAIDRNALVSLFGGPKAATPLCELLPLGFPDHEDNCQYTSGATGPGQKWSGPDLAKAKQLVAQSGTAGDSVTIVAGNDSVNTAMATYVQSVMKSLGYHASLKLLSGNISYNYMQNSKNKVNASITWWFSDFPAPASIIEPLLACSSFHPKSESSPNIAGYCNKSLDDAAAAAEQKELTDKTAAGKLWANVDQQYMTASPIVPTFTPNRIDFVSARVGNYQYSNQYWMQADQLWVH